MTLESQVTVADNPKAITRVVSSALLGVEQLTIINMNTESECWLKESDKIIAAYPEKHRDYHAMQLRHAYERGQLEQRLKINSIEPAEKLLLEIGHTIAERLEKIRIDSDKEPWRQNASCDIKTEDMLDMITRSIHTYKLTQAETVAETPNVRISQAAKL